MRIYKASKRGFVGFLLSFEDVAGLDAFADFVCFEGLDDPVGLEDLESFEGCEGFECFEVVMKGSD
jgi:hypothetical protein